MSGTETSFVERTSGHPILTAPPLGHPVEVSSTSGKEAPRTSCAAQRHAEESAPPGLLGNNFRLQPGVCALPTDRCGGGTGQAGYDHRAGNVLHRFPCRMR